MVKKNKKWEWTKRQEKAFKELKNQFTKEPVLAALDLDKIKSRGGHFRLCDRRGVINGSKKWKMETGCFPFQVIE